MSQPISVQDSAQVVCGGAARQVMLEDIWVNHKQQNGGCNAASPTLLPVSVLSEIVVHDRLGLHAKTVEHLDHGVAHRSNHRDRSIDPKE